MLSPRMVLPLAAYRRAALVSIFLMLYPVFFWVLFVVGLNGEFYNHAMHGARQIAWVFDTAHQGGGAFLGALWSTTSLHLRSVARVALPFVGVLALFLLLNRSGESETAADPDGAEIVRPAQRACHLYFLLHFFYLWFIGTGFDRLTYVLVPIVLCLLGIEMERFLRRKEQAVTLATGSLYGIGLAWVLYHVLKHGPFS